MSMTETDAAGLLLELLQQIFPTQDDGLNVVQPLFINLPNDLQGLTIQNTPGDGSIQQFLSGTDHGNAVSLWATFNPNDTPSVAVVAITCDLGAETVEFSSNNISSYTFDQPVHAVGFTSDPVPAGIVPAPAVFTDDIATNSLGIDATVLLGCSGSGIVVVNVSPPPGDTFTTPITHTVVDSALLSIYVRNGWSIQAVPTTTSIDTAEWV
jgi:hypothetical protein